MKNSFKNLLKKFRKNAGFISRLLGWRAKNTENREISPPEIRDIGHPSVERSNPEIDASVEPIRKATMTTKTTCPYCNSPDYVKRGVRQKKQ